MCIETKILSLLNASKELRKYELLKGVKLYVSSYRHACTIVP